MRSHWRRYWHRYFGVSLFLLIATSGLIWILFKTGTLEQWARNREKRDFIGKTRPILEHSTVFELYSLYDERSIGKDMTAPKEWFGQWPTYGKVVITDPGQKAALISALYASIDAYHGYPAACFMPHHGIHASDGQHQVDLIICFTCKSIEGTYDRIPISATNDGRPMELFNKELAAAGIPLDPWMKRE